MRLGSGEESAPVPFQAIPELQGPNRIHLILGNGFSIACSPIFHYGSLYDVAVAKGLSPRAQQVFGHLGTNNFEGVLRLLDDSHWVATAYGLIPNGNVSEILGDAEIIKNTLLQAIAASHLEQPNDIASERKDRTLAFLKRFHSVFCTNYDLLLCWLNMHAGEDPSFQDGFRSDADDPDAPYLVFSKSIKEKPGFYFLHGCLQFYVAGGQIRKHSWKRTGIRLIEQVRDALGKGDYPLFVAEGNSEKKLEQINRSGYLWYCMNKLQNAQGTLVVLGHSLGDSDDHICEAILRNLQISKLWVGLFGDPDSPVNQGIREKMAQLTAERGASNRGKPLAVSYFDSATVPIW